MKIKIKMNIHVHKVKGGLVELLYERAVRDLEGARELMLLDEDPRAMADAIQLIVHAQAIITELQASLNLKAGGELAVNLLRIYEYMQYRLSESVKAKKHGGIDEVKNLLYDLAGKPSPA